MGRRIVLAADRMRIMDVSRLAGRIGHLVDTIKIHDLFDAEGPPAIDLLKRAGSRVWVDLKIHDIPATAKSRIEELVGHGADVVTVHASGGIRMMSAALEAAKGAKIYAVTALTSLSENEVNDIYTGSRKRTTLNLASLAVTAGVHGVVCSPNEVALLRATFKNQTTYIVPGVRSAGKDVHDQENVQTPAQAIKDGADLIVVGRQVTEAKDPIAALAEIEREIEGAASRFS